MTEAQYIQGEFYIPMRKEALLETPQTPNPNATPVPSDSSRFSVKTRKNVCNWSEEQLLKELNTINESLSGQGGGQQNHQKCLNLLSHQDNFDGIYSIMFYLEEMSVTVRKFIIENLNKNMKQFIKIIEKHNICTGHIGNINLSGLKSGVDINTFRVLMKAYVWLIVWFLTENSKIKVIKDLQNKVKKGPKGQKAKGDQNAGSKEEITNNLLNEIKMHIIQAIGYFIEIIKMDGLVNLWPDQRVEEDFAKIFIKLGFDLLENETYTKSTELKENIFDLLNSTMQKFGDDIRYMQTQNSTKIINLLYTQDNIAQHMAEFVAMVAKRTEGQEMASDIIKELSKQIFHNDSSHETIGIKNVGIFLKKLSKLTPKLIYTNISNLLGFFDCEAYLLRQSIIKILGNTITYVLTQECDNQHTMTVYNQTKEKFLELLLKRFYDKSAYCRSKVIKIFIKLTEANVVPRFKYFDLLRGVIGRLKDQTTHVRKNALKLFAQMIVIYGMIFNVDIKRGNKFMTLEEILRETEQAKYDNVEVKKKNEELMVHEKQLRIRIIREKGIEDQAQLMAALNENLEYQQIIRKSKEINELIESNSYIISTLKEYEEFIKIVDDAISFLTLLLSSKTIQDTIETIKVFRLLYQFGIKNSIVGIKRMLTLMFSKDISVQQAVFDCYRTIYFDQTYPVQEKTKNLLQILKDATLTDLVCIEELLKKFVANDLFEKEVYNSLWRYYTHPSKALVTKPNQAMTPEQLTKQRLQSKEEQRNALQLLRMIGTSKIDVLIAQKDNLYEYSQKFAKFEKPDFILLKEALLIYEKIVLHQQKIQASQPQSKIKQKKEAQINDIDKKYLFQLFSVVIQSFGTDDLEWFCATEAILNTLFNIKTRNSPEYAKFFIQQLTRKLYTYDKKSSGTGKSDKTAMEMMEVENNSPKESESINNQNGNILRTDINDMHYAQLFFVVGHVAIKMLTYIEQIDAELKRSVHEKSSNEKKQKDTESEGSTVQHQQSEDMEDELDQIGGGKEAEIEKYSLVLHKITEEALIQDGMLGKFLPPITAISQKVLEKYQNITDETKVPTICVLERSAILALCKIMCVSSQICTQNLGILFQLLSSKIDYGLKANIIITIGDLFNRFPNTLNEKTKDIFTLLHDSSSYVKRQALMVITHLILNDMLKLKGEIVDICMLLEDTDDRLRDQVKLFLHELHSKANHIIYNLFPKAISRLSKEFSELKREEFENIAKNLLTYIDKDRQTEQLVEKLVSKLKNSTNQIEWRNTAFCLSQLRYNEKIFLKLLDAYDSYKDKLIKCFEVREYFILIVQQVKKFTKPELKKSVDEFEMKVNADENLQIRIKQQQRINDLQNKTGSGKSNKKKRNTGPSTLPILPIGQALMNQEQADAQMKNPGNQKRTRQEMLNDIKNEQMAVTEQKLIALAKRNLNITQSALKQPLQPQVSPLLANPAGKVLFQQPQQVQQPSGVSAFPFSNQNQPILQQQIPQQQQQKQNVNYQQQLQQQLLLKQQQLLMQQKLQQNNQGQPQPNNNNQYSLQQYSMYQQQIRKQQQLADLRGKSGLAGDENDEEDEDEIMLEGDDSDY